MRPEIRKAYFPGFLKSQLLEGLHDLFKKHEFLENVFYFINGINKVCTFYVITTFYSLRMRSEIRKAYFPRFLKSQLLEGLHDFLKNTSF